MEKGAGVMDDGSTIRASNSTVAGNAGQGHFEACHGDFPTPMDFELFSGGNASCDLQSGT
jgi:hypothetical protein